MHPSVRLPEAPPWPAAFLLGPAHRIVHGNPAFLDAFGASCVGQPAREALVDLPSAAFRLMDRVLRDGRPLACRLSLRGGDVRLVVAPRQDPETRETYGVAAHLRPAGLRGDVTDQRARSRAG
jgi:hypothetical protein